MAPPTIDDVLVVNTNTGTSDSAPISSTAVHGAPSFRVRENVGENGSCPSLAMP